MALESNAIQTWIGSTRTTLIKCSFSDRMNGDVSQMHTVRLLWLSTNRGQHSGRWHTGRTDVLLGHVVKLVDADFLEVDARRGCLKGAVVCTAAEQKAKFMNNELINSHSLDWRCVISQWRYTTWHCGWLQNMKRSTFILVGLHDLF